MVTLRPIVAPFLLLASAAAAQDPICADRPSKATSPCTAPAGRFQIESELARWSLQKDHGTRETSLWFGETTLKYGLDDHSDLQVEVAPWQRLTVGIGLAQRRWTGLGDVEVRYKREMTSADAPVRLALMPFVKIPTAKQPLGNGKVETGLLVPMQFQAANSNVSFNFTPELDRNVDADRGGYHWAMQQVGSINLAVSERLTVTAELWGQWEWDPAGDESQASVDAAGAYLLSDDIQLDAGANFGVNRRTPDVEVYAGIAMRF